LLKEEERGRNKGAKWKERYVVLCTRVEGGSARVRSNEGTREVRKMCTKHLNYTGCDGEEFGELYLSVWLLMTTEEMMPRSTSVELEAQSSSWAINTC
jgi:hypothetical protein